MHFLNEMMPAAPESRNSFLLWPSCNKKRMWVRGLAQFWSFKIFLVPKLLEYLSILFHYTQKYGRGFFSISFPLYFCIFFLIIRLESKITNMTLWKVILWSTRIFMIQILNDNYITVFDLAEGWRSKKSKTLAKRKRDRVAHIGIDTVSTLVKL